MKTVAAIQLDADICNTVDPPVRGCHAGFGIHVLIPADYQARILAGEDMPGCNYHRLDSGQLVVSDVAIAQLSIPAVINLLSASLKAEAAILNTKLASAVSMQLQGTQ